MLIQRDKVEIASSAKIPFLATGGGHSTSIQPGRLHDGLQIDLSNFDSVKLDAENNLLTVGGATRFAQIIDILYDAGKQFRKFEISTMTSRIKS